MKRFLFALLGLAAVASVAAVGPRLAYDRTQGNQVALAANLGDIVEIADAQGLPVRSVLERFAEAGLTSVVATPDFLARIEAERGPVLAGPALPEWLPLLPGEPGESRSYVNALVDAVAAELASGVRARAVVFGGSAVPGYPDDLDLTAARLAELGLRVGFVEDPSQLGYVPLPGTAETAALTGYSLVRVYHQPAAALYRPDRIIQKITRSVKDRSLRVVWLDLFKFAGEAPAAWVSRPSGEIGSLAASLTYVENTAESLRSTGFAVGPPAAGSAGRPFSASPYALALVALGPWAATLLLLDLGTRGRLSEVGRSGPVLAGLGVASLVLAAVFWLCLRVLPVLARQGAALWAALVYPSLALVWLEDRWISRRSAVPGPGALPADPRALPALPRALPALLGEVLPAVAIAVLGGLAVAGLLADARFVTEIAYFRGVKLSYIVPPFVGLVAGVWLVGREPWARRAWRDALGFLTAGTRVWHVVVAAAVAVVAVVYVGRSGDQPWLPVSDTEITVRIWLDRVFHAQPRVKEFLIGYPALAAGSYLALTGLRRWLPVWAAVGGVGLVSVVNSFEHVRTPLALTLMRTWNGAWLGLGLGILATHVTAGLLRAVQGRHPAAFPGRGEAPGDGTGEPGRASPEEPRRASPQEPGWASPQEPGRASPEEPGRPAGQAARGRVEILGVRFDRLTSEEATAEAIRLVRVAPEGPAARLIFTPNPEIVARANRDPAFRAVLNSADLAVADGIGVVWASRLLGKALPERVSGFDLFVTLLARGPEVWGGGRNLRVFLLGGRPGVAREAGERIAAAYPGVTVVGEHHGYFTDDAGPLDAIRRAGPDLVAVGMGSPKQETWLVANREALGGVAAIGVGGSFDVLSARTKRAPAWVRSINLEWLYRILSEPRARLRRAPALAGFVLSVIGAALTSRFGKRG